ncbi:MAG: hypothetical protein AAFR17_08010 [Pseudomonadota bacterium]
MDHAHMQSTGRPNPYTDAPHDHPTEARSDQIEAAELELPNALWVAAPGLALALYGALMAVAFFA